MNEMVLGFAGRIASGKSTLSKEVAQSLGWQRVSFGDYVRSVAQNQGLSESREVLQKIGASLIEGGMQQFCCAVLTQNNWQVGQPLVIDGIRHAEIIPILRQAVAPLEFRLILIELNPQIRKKRLLERELGDREKQQLIDVHSTELQVNTLFPTLADLTVDGNQTIEELVKVILEYVEAD